jgi:hypothetical protein
MKVRLLDRLRLLGDRTVLIVAKMGFEETRRFCPLYVSPAKGKTARNVRNSRDNG